MKNYSIAHLVRKSIIVMSSVKGNIGKHTNHYAILIQSIQSLKHLLKNNLIK
jgi:hypothetical protein